MKTFTCPLLSLLIGLTSAVLSATPFAAPMADRLERPSRISASASQAPLTGVQRLGQRLVLVGADGHILVREPDGRLHQAKVPVDVLLTAVHFVDDRQGWAVGHDGVVLHSTDGGENWDKQLDGRTINTLMLTWAEAEVARLEQVASAQDSDNAAQLQALDNARFALDDITAGAVAGPSRPLLDVWFANADEGWVVGAYGMALHTRDGGKRWEYLPDLDNPERLHLNAVLALANGDLLIAGEGGRLYRRVDGQWLAAQQLTPASLYKLVQLRDGEVLAMGFGAALFVSNNHGQDWKPIPLGTKASLYGAEQLADGSLWLTGQAGVLLHSQDLQQFHLFQSAIRGAWLGVATLGDTQLALVGNKGLHVLAIHELKELR
ncbi:hypothetical protein HKK55_12835 [Pseudomonas sp. ADAK18]|uniref:WD40/YVTN/BNR-like repeat-containing protein n=1 Tax=Pseudomonas sp. ADAK18 TaxID=2730848 RepID=UPI001462E420|nr:YCF48-related protein [Pseudomonas sp. ADAK18]QJI29565.1 hypothetical protein HKK55_12835 [Pseudomonas sp. ADAK18]